MKFRRRVKLPPQCGIERLEDRLLLSGNPILLAETEPTPSSTLGDYQLSLEVSSDAAVTTEAEPNNSINAPNVFMPGAGSVIGTITADDVDYYMFTVTQPGLFIAHVNTSGSNLDGRLSLYGPDQKLRMSSDNSAPGSVEPALSLHLNPGMYWLAVDASPLAAPGAAIGDYSLDTTFTLASSPFAPQPTGPDGGSGLFPHGIATGDFNGDGVADLVTADNGSGQISVLLGVNASNDPTKPRGDFSYQPAQLFTVGFSPVAVIATEAESGASADGTIKEVPLDFNDDGITDLAIVNSGDLTGAASVTILYGDGQGNFRHRVIDDSGEPILDDSGNPVDDVPVGSEASAIAAADFDGDGRSDFAVTNATDGTVSIFLQQTDGSFVQIGSAIAVGQAPENPGDPAVSAPRDIIAGDFDGDGHVDLATADSGTSSVTVLYGDSTGAFSMQTLDLPAGATGQSMRPTSLVAAKLNGDTFFDFAVADANLDTGSDDITTILGGAGRTFQVNDPVVVKNLPTTGGQSEFDATVAVADFNGDGKLDLALSDIAEARIAIVLGKGDGTFNLPAHQFMVNPGSAPRGIVVGDFNNDGRVDFTTADGESEFNYGPNDQRSSVTIFGGKGDGTFLSGPQLQTDATPSSLAIADFNDDGRADIITANGDDASLLLNNGDAMFQSSTSIDAGPSNIVAIGDFNGDGRMDIITTDYF
ncbi:MAG TPA: FG-GAP-like repeat-containing protein, partial [Pirellulales bacterium]